MLLAKITQAQRRRAFPRPQREDRAASAATRPSSSLSLKNGIDSETGKKIQTLLKQSKLKVQAAIQGDAVRVTGAKRDDLQAAIALLRKEIADLPLSFTNFRD